MNTKGTTNVDRLLYTADQTAHLLSISKRKVFLLIEQGHLDSIKVGHSRRIRREDIDTFIAQQIETEAA